MKIMIVDDHEAMRCVLRSIVSLSSSSTKADEIIECVSGEEAVGKYILHHPDCVLMDIELTGMNGFETIKKIFSQDPQASIIIITSHDTLSFRKRAEKLQVKGFITKDKLSNLNEIIKAISPNT